MKAFCSILSIVPFLLFGDDPRPYHHPTPSSEKPKAVPDHSDLFNKNSQGFMLNGEFIYWNVQEGALDYAIRMRNRSWGPSLSYAQGDFERAEFNWDPGYRFSIGYYRAPNFWEAIFEYTFLHVKGNQRVKAPNMDEARFLTGTFPQIFDSPMRDARSHIHLHYQLVNLLAKRVFHPFDNPHLRIRLGSGITALFIHQGWNVQYFSINNAQTTTENRWRYWGIGLRVGSGFDWYWGNDIYATGIFSLALTMGHYHNHAKQKTSDPVLPGDNPEFPVRDARYKDYRMAISSQFLLGPSYQKAWNWLRFELFAGYELTTWSNLQEVFRSTAGTSEKAKETLLNSGLIALHGLTLRATLNF